MFRFKDAFGTPDMEAVEKLSWEKRQELAARYSLYQSSDYGQTILANDDVHTDTVVAFPNPIDSGSNVHVSMPDVRYTLSLYNMAGNCVYQEEKTGATDIHMSFPSGVYTMVLLYNGKADTQRLIVK